MNHVISQLPQFAPSVFLRQIRASVRRANQHLESARRETDHLPGSGYRGGHRARPRTADARAAGGL